MKFVLLSTTKATIMYAQIEGNQIQLYGTIWGGDGPYIVSQLKKILAATGEVDIHIHSPGGSVIDGNLIYNAIAGSKATVTMVNDGLAASMGAILMLAGSSAKMAENAFMMIHAPSGYTQGNAKAFESTAKVLRNMESNFLKKLATTTGKSADELKDWMDGDNWFTAEEAMQAGLIAEIIDTVIADNAEMSAYQDIKMSASLFEAYDKPKEPKQKPPKNKGNMAKLSAEALTKLGLSADASDAQIEAAIAAQNERITKMENDAASRHTAAVKSFVEGLVASGKILASETEQVTADATKDLEATQRAYAKVPEKSSLTGRQKTPTTSAGEEDRSTWTHADYRKKDTVALLAIKANDHEAYKKLCEDAGIKL